MGKLTKILKPTYLQHFKCIGGDCEDSCCIGWNIDIDKLTYRKYFRTNNSLMKDKFKKYLYKNEYCEFEEVDYGKVKILKNKWCPFLNRDKLCDIYNNLGEEYLSNVCHSFPRIYNVLNNTYELSLSMSCPEAVRMLFDDKKPITFVEENSVLDKHIIHSYVNLKDKHWNGSPIKNLKELREMSINTLQNRNLKIDKRLSLLGSNLEKKKQEDVPLNVTDVYRFQLNFFKYLISILNVDSEIDSQVFIQYTQYCKAISRSKDIYQKILDTIVNPFIEKNEYLFEHYLVNAVFQSNFPFNINQDQFDGYLILIVRFVFIKFYLSGLAFKNGKLTKEDIISMVQVHTKIVNHHDTFILQTLENVKDKDFDNLNFVNTLLA